MYVLNISVIVSYLEFLKYSNLHKGYQNDDDLLGSRLISQSWIYLKYLSYLKVQLNYFLITLFCMVFSILPKMNPMLNLSPYLTILFIL